MQQESAIPGKTQLLGGPFRDLYFWQCLGATTREIHWMTSKLQKDELALKTLTSEINSWFLPAEGKLLEQRKMVRTVDTLRHKVEWALRDRSMADVASLCKDPNTSNQLTPDCWIAMNETLKRSYLAHQLHRRYLENGTCAGL